MTKKSSNQNMSYKEELLNAIEPNFIFSKKAVKRIKAQKIKSNINNKIIIFLFSIKII